MRLLHCYTSLCRAHPLNPTQLILRGASLKNTKWIFGKFPSHYKLLLVCMCLSLAFHSNQSLSMWIHLDCYCFIWCTHVLKQNMPLLSIPLLSFTGLTVYTGKESKVMLNSTAAPLKRSTVERQTNTYVSRLVLFSFIFPPLSGCPVFNFFFRNFTNSLKK